MITKQATIYICEHCDRKMFNKGAMSLHERMCKHNPNNQHKCFKYCKWLKKTTEWDHNIYFDCGNMECELSNMNLHSYKLERDYIGQLRIKTEKLVRMPLKCEHYEIEKGHYY